MFIILTIELYSCVLLGLKDSWDIVGTRTYLSSVGFGGFGRNCGLLKPDIGVVYSSGALDMEMATSGVLWKPSFTVVSLSCITGRLVGLKYSGSISLSC